MKVMIFILWQESRQYFNIKCIPEKSLNGDISTVLMVVRYISNRLPEKETLRSETIFESVLKASPDVITITDLQGILEYVSPNAAELFGYENNDQIIHRSLFDFLAPEDHEKAMIAIGQMFAGNFPGAEEYTGIKADGSGLQLK